MPDLNGLQPSYLSLAHRPFATCPPWPHMEQGHVLMKMGESREGSAVAVPRMESIHMRKLMDKGRIDSC